MNLLDDVVECLTERWHESDDVRSLPEYLGMTAEQFGRWSAGVMSAQELQAWADRRGIRVGEAP